MKRWLLPALALMLAACSGAPKKATPPAGQQSPDAQADAKATSSPYAPAQEDPGKRGNYTSGGLYAPEIQDSAPDELPDVARIPEPVVRDEPRSRYGNRPTYSVLGKSYHVMDSAKDYVERGIASYYGKKFHGRRTSSMEVYDMYTFSAAHKTLPLPSYARVTNLGNGKSVVVRVNDRGPFHAGRIIDLSYAAAVKLGVHRSGTAKVEVRGLSPGENARQPDEAVAAVAPAPVPVDILPAGVRIATGKPQPMPPSAIDRLVAVLPIASANADERVASAAMPAVAPAIAAGRSASADRAVALPDADNLEWRFDMHQDGRAMTANEFDAWLHSRRARVATGKPGTPDPRTASRASSTKTEVPAAVAVRNVASKPVPAPMATPTKPGSGDSVVLQVAAFAAHDNAERALAILHDAGIGGARLHDVQANGRKMWRLRVGPVDSGESAELGARIEGLGFGQPQRVRE